MIRNQKIKRTFITFILDPLFYKWMWVFHQSLLDCFSIRVYMSSYVKYILLHLTELLYAGVHFLQFLNALTCSPITIFFKRL